MLDGINKPLIEQIEILKEILLSNQKLKLVLEKLEEYNLDNYYVAAGCINQTVFNYYHNFDLMYGIEDIDIVYYDNDITYEKEDKIIKDITNLLDIDIKLDIKNEARVHLWYYEKYNKKINQYINLEDAINSWGTTITCIGVKLVNNNLIVYAPYGLNDLFTLTIRPIKKQFTYTGYQVKTKKWLTKWPKLNIIDWNN